VYRRVLLAGTALAVAATAFIVGVSTAQAAGPFVTRSGTSLVLDGQPFRFGGTNNYYLHYKSNLMVEDVFADAAAMNLKVIRAWSSLECGGAKPNSAGGCSQGTDLWMQRWSATTNAVEYNTGPGGLPKLDFLLAKANQYGIKVILPLVNNWRDFGGMDQYVTWYGLQYHDQFYTDPRIRQDYKNWVSTLANRTNSITGVKYRDDPAILAWELANEPRRINGTLPTSGTCTAQTLVTWATEMSAHIKSVDPNHLVAAGDEGFLNWNRPGDWPYNGADGVDHEALTAVPNIDFATYHVYPDSWGKNVDWVTQWIKDHTTAQATHGKPVVLEEFGYSNQSGRSAAYQTWTDTARTQNQSGWLFWILTGVQDDGQLYPDYDGFRVTYPSDHATVLSNAAVAIGGPLVPRTTAPTTPPTTRATTPPTTRATTPPVTTPVTTTPVTTQPTTPPTTRTTPTVVVDQPCVASYAIVNQWPGGFQGQVTVRGGPVPISGWMVSFTFPNGQVISQVWAGRHTTSTGIQYVRNESWNGSLNASTSTSFGFIASWSGVNSPPTSISCGAA
jgi:mannan endo-1,4-beta-mannosidase